MILLNIGLLGILDLDSFNCIKNVTLTNIDNEQVWTNGRRDK